MQSLAVFFAIALLITTAILNLIGKRVLSCWLLALFPAAICAGTLIDLSLGVRYLGQASFDTDVRTIPSALALLAVTVLAALRSRWRWLFWIAWLANALICGVVVYLAFFWKVFS
jgi:hypothetical protein